MVNLSHIRVAVLATDGFEEVELTDPIRALESTGASTEIISSDGGQIQGFRWGQPGLVIPTTWSVASASESPEAFNALLIPGGELSINRFKRSREALSLIQQLQAAEKPIASLDHGPALLAAAGLVRGKRLAGNSLIATDIIQAGGFWMNQKVVTEENWVTAQDPAALPEFIGAMLELMSRPVPMLSHGSRDLAFKTRFI